MHNNQNSVSDKSLEVGDVHIMQAFDDLEIKEKPLFTDHPTLNIRILQKKNLQ